MNLASKGKPQHYAVAVADHLPDISAIVLQLIQGIAGRGVGEIIFHRIGEILQRALSITSLQKLLA